MGRHGVRVSLLLPGLTLKTPNKVILVYASRAMGLYMFFIQKDTLTMFTLFGHFQKIMGGVGLLLIKFLPMRGIQEKISEMIA